MYDFFYHYQTYIKIQKNIKSMLNFNYIKLFTFCVILIK